MSWREGCCCPDITMFLSKCLCQKLGKGFGKKRQRGKVMKNPNACNFIKITQAFHTINNGVSHDTTKISGKRESPSITAIAMS